MNVIPVSLYTVAFTLCAFSAGVLNRRKSRVSLWFIAFLLIESLCFACELLMHDPAAPLKAVWLGLRMCCSLLIAPCLWMAVREIAEGTRPKVASLGWRHFAPIAAGVLFTMPLFQTAHFGVDYPDPHHRVSWLHSVFIHATMLLCILIFSVQVPVYLRRCRRAVDAANCARRWLYFPMIIALTTWLLGIVRTLQCMLVTTRIEFVIAFALAEVGVTAAAIYVIVTRAADPEPKYARSSLDAAARERIRRRIVTAMSETALYRDSLLTLRSLSATIRESPHNVSQVLNQDLGCTFYELVNRYRIERARKELVDDPDRTVLDVALSVGFASKSTFNTAFRRHTGATPREFRSARPV
ncbi:MAG TPA: helix-turn-helix domain-containing protein [Bryobacteraceae bacterium]|nr:helix-turn-helix domain-containing protein [Bryobacteraceae bacterium]